MGDLKTKTDEVDVPNYEEQELSNCLLKNKECFTEDNDEFDWRTGFPETDATKRDQWSHRCDFILSLLGYSVGLGNLWRFPYLCMRNGGGAFLIPFMICLITCGMPIYFLELSIGQFHGNGVIQAWVVCPLFKGVGYGMLLGTTIWCLYYNMIIAWSLYYLINSFSARLPWTICDGWWNTNNCYIKMSDIGDNTTSETNVTSDLTYLTNVTGTNSVQRTSEEEFWQFNVLRISAGLEDLGGLSWHLVLSLLGAWVIVFFCIMKGIRSIGKVVYVTATLPYLLLVVLLIRGATLPGAADGIIYYLKPDFERMMRIQVWLEASLQVFYSLGSLWGPLITMASYNKFNNNCLRNAVFASFVGEGTSLLCGFVVFATLGFIAHDLDVPIGEVVKSGPGLGFIAYPQALARLPLPQVWSVLFFLTLITVGLDSQFSSVETVICGFLDSYPRLRKRRVLISALCCAICFFMGLVFCLQGGVYVLQLVDWYVAIFVIPVFGFIECLIFGWIYGAERFSRDVELMLGRGVPVFIRICWCIVTPVALLVCQIFLLVSYKPPVYNEYSYPAFAEGIGWFIAFLPLLPLFLIGGYKLYTSKSSSGSITEKIFNTLKPTPDWKPYLEDAGIADQKSGYQYQCWNGSMLRRLKVNLLGDNSS